MSEEINQETPSKNPSRLPIVLTIVVIVGSLAFFAYQKTNRPQEVELLNQETQETTGSPIATPEQTEEVISSEDKVSTTGGFSLTVTSPLNNSTVKTASFVVKGATIPGAEVWVNETQATVDAKGNYSATVILEEGENYLLVAGGNETDDAEIERVVYFEK